MTTPSSTYPQVKAYLEELTSRRESTRRLCLLGLAEQLGDMHEHFEKAAPLWGDSERGDLLDAATAVLALVEKSQELARLAEKVAALEDSCAWLLGMADDLLSRTSHDTRCTLRKRYQYLGCTCGLEDLHDGFSRGVKERGLGPVDEVPR